MKGSRFIDVTMEHLKTLEKYNLLSDLIDSSGMVDDTSLNKLQLNVKALLEHTEDNEDLLRLCKDVLFHDNMKAFGLHQLILLYIENSGK
jgi:hypothetical protein